MTHDLVRLSAAVVASAAYAALCVACLWRRRRSSTPAAGAILMAYASQTGFAEALARSASQGLRRAGREVELVELGAVTSDTLARASVALFVVATTGEGDPPDRALRFVRTVMAGTPDLSRVSVGVLALGDRSYARFCAFGRRLETWLQDRGASHLFDMIEVDAGDPVSLERWRRALGGLTPRALGEMQEPAPAAVRLTARTCLNPRGLGDPAFLLAFAGPPSLGAWQAGDVVEIERPTPAGIVHREYSIASLPADGSLELIVRRLRAPDGATGAMSGWLTEELPVGGEVRLRVRSNRSFHRPDGAAHLILVGAGTGLAGLRAHIHALPRKGEADAWLIFGERARQTDHLLHDEFLQWTSSGVVGRLDLAFSRDGGPVRYVQDVLRNEAERLRRQVGAGAVILVCGRQAMGQDVDRALRAILGEEAVQDLLEKGRYLRDVY